MTPQHYFFCQFCSMVEGVETTCFESSLHLLEASIKQHKAKYHQVTTGAQERLGANPNRANNK